ncbi:autotransporter domain-containing protein [Neomesorhizobium albiziae]|uniref:autotransporter family protein n=1 Tax=Neomesorhizobium albiziae TaxID=335020 RepID=UPI00122CDC74|nr:autotransporter domain-containing protein [Mesorhizobium albiziae]GLS33535.1 autotransporter [Mesorhizobium albiziae]
MNAPAATGVTVNINPDATITGTGPLFALGQGARITNHGSIQVISTGSGAVGVIADANSIVSNFGTIATSGFNSLSAFGFADNVVLRNEAGAQISISGDSAAGLLIGGGNNSTLFNAGRITLNTFQGGGLFAQEGSGHILVNAATGMIESNLDLAFGMNAQGGFSSGAGTDFLLLNEGTIITRGQASHGMLLNELTSSSAINSGSITTSGGSSETVNRAFGMFSFEGGGNTLLNTATGIITASGLGSSGMEMFGGSGNLLRNEGTLNISGAGAHGIYVLSGTANTLDNRGTLNITGPRGNGLRADDGGNTLLNSGSILVGGSDAFGVFMQGTANTLTNSGTIRATGVNADGVVSNTVAGSFAVTIENTGSIVSDRRFAVRGVNGQETVVNSGLIGSGVGTAIDLRAGNDSVILRTGSQINGLADGGAGSDRVILEGTGTATNEFRNFETLRMTGTDWTWLGSGAFLDTQIESGVLRVNGLLTSPVTVQAGTTLAGTGVVAGNVFNQGVVSPGNSIGTLTINGNYVGQGGTLLIESVLGDDSSPSDKLVIGGGVASGSTPMQVVNVGGTGALTTGNGIPVVEAVNAGTTALDAFMLAGRVAAGAYEYALYRGGLDVGTEADWFLRSTAPPVPEPVPEPEPGVPDPPPPGEPVPPPGSPPPPPVPAPTAFPPLGSTPSGPTPPMVFPPIVPTPGRAVPPPSPGATRVVADVVPLYRIEVPTYAAIPPVAHHLALSTLGTFHERRGEQVLLNDAGWLPTVWGRVFGQDVDMKSDGTVAPSFDGTLFGFQAGADLFGWESTTDHHDRVGLFIGHARIDGDVKGQALGWNDLQVGDADVNGTSLGAYWTHVGPTDWYLDGVLMGTWFGGDSTSLAGVGIDVDGTAVTASLEGGYPIALTPEWTLEPQAQLIWQHLSLDDQADRFSTVSFDSDDAVTGRLGFRLQGNFQTEAANFQPYFKANLWHNFDADQRIIFAETPIVTEIGGTALELGGGVVAKLSESTSLFATADYTTNLGSEKLRVFEGNLGISVKW